MVDSWVAVASWIFSEIGSVYLSSSDEAKPTVASLSPTDATLGASFSIPLPVTSAFAIAASVAGSVTAYFFPNGKAKSVKIAPNSNRAGKRLT